MHCKVLQKLSNSAPLLCQRDDSLSLSWRFPRIFTLKLYRRCVFAGGKKEPATMHKDCQETWWSLLTDQRSAWLKGLSSQRLCVTPHRTTLKKASVHIWTSAPIIPKHRITHKPLYARAIIDESSRIHWSRDKLIFRITQQVPILLLLHWSYISSGAALNAAHHNRPDFN